MGLFGFLKKKDAAFYVESGETALAAGQFDEAEKCFAKAIELAEEKKEYKPIGTATLRLGEIAERQDKIAIAEKQFTKAFRHHQDLEEDEDAAKCLMKLGIVIFKQRRLGESTQLFGTAQKFFQDVDPNHTGVAESLMWLSKSCMGEKHFPMAEKHARTAIGFVETRSSDDEMLAELWTLTGQCCVEQNKNAEAEEAFKKAVSIYDKHLSTAKQLELCSCLHAYGRHLTKQNKKSQAKEVMQRASKICQDTPGYLEEAELASDLAKLS